MSHLSDKTLIYRYSEATRQRRNKTWIYRLTGIHVYLRFVTAEYRVPYLLNLHSAALQFFFLGSFLLHTKCRKRLLKRFLNIQYDHLSY